MISEREPSFYERETRPRQNMERSQEVLFYLTQGLTTEKIGEELSITKNTVKTYLSRIRKIIAQRTGRYVSLGTELVYHGIRSGEVSFSIDDETRKKIEELTSVEKRILQTMEERQGDCTKKELAKILSYSEASIKRYLQLISAKIGSKNTNNTFAMYLASKMQP